ncbi:MAG: BON domain-containing protein [Pyrinomonadaceae bacterium]
MKYRFIALFMAIVVASVGFTACETGSNMNANIRNANANSSIVVVNSNANSFNRNAYGSNKWDSNITREEYEKNKSEYEREKGSSSIGQGANDMWLWVKTKSSLTATDDLRDSTINVDVVNDVVKLKGTVGTAAQKASAERVADAIDGVKDVKNELKVQPDDSISNQVVNGNSAGNRNP